MRRESARWNSNCRSLPASITSGGGSETDAPQSPRSSLSAGGVFDLLHGVQPIAGPLESLIDLFPPDRRRRDVDNVQKALLDALAHGGAYHDDSQIARFTDRAPCVVPGGKVQVRIQEYRMTSRSLIPSRRHYTFSRIEVIDAIEAWQLGFHLGNVVKYVARRRKRSLARGSEKARWYLDREIARSRQEKGVSGCSVPKCSANSFQPQSIARSATGLAYDAFRRTPRPTRRKYHSGER